MFKTRKWFEEGIRRRLDEQERSYYMEQRFRDVSERTFKLENDIAKLACRISVLEGKEGGATECVTVEK